jgi:hypothetical protein
MCKGRRGRQSMLFMTRTSALRDRGEDRASFQDRGREKILNVQETKGKTELVF